MLTRRQILLLPAAVAVAARAIFAVVLAGSPFRFFHCVPGLDMQTLWEFAAPGGAPTLLVAPRLLFQLVRRIGQGPFTLFCLQALIGAVGAALCADLARHFTRDRFSALCAGIIYALYAPFLVYEFSVLQEALLLNLILLAVWIFYRALPRRASSGWVLAAALVSAFAALGRPVALPLGIAAGIYLVVRRAGRSKVALYWGGYCGMLILAMIFNYVSAKTWSPFFRVGEYIVTLNAGTGAAVDSGSSWLIVAGRSLTRLPGWLSARSIAENLNLYFLERQLPLLGRLLRPEGVIPLGVAGWVLMISTPRFRRRAVELSGILLLLAVPLSFRPVMERYQLILVPYLIICGAFTVAFFRRHPARLELLGGIGVVASAYAVLFLLSPPPTLRADDFISWGHAAEAGAQMEESMAAFRSGWEIFHDRRAALNLVRRLHAAREPLAAAQVCREYLALYPGDEAFTLYLAGCLASAGNRAAAREVLQNMSEPRDQALQARYRVLKNLVEP